MKKVHGFFETKKKPDGCNPLEKTSWSELYALAVSWGASLVTLKMNALPEWQEITQLKIEIQHF